MTWNFIASLLAMTALLFFVMTASAFAAESAALAALKAVPVQHEGRVKPLDALAREDVRLITSKETWSGRPAIAVIMDVIARPDTLPALKWIRIDYPELKRDLGLAENEKFFSFAEVYPAVDKIQNLVKSAKAKRSKDERPSKLEQKAELLYSKLAAVEELASGDAVRVIPEGPDAAWASPRAAGGELADGFNGIIEKYKAGTLTSSDVETWTKKIYAAAPDASAFKIKLEVWYYRLHPFQWAALFYLLAFILLWKKPGGSTLSGNIALALAMLFHTLGLAMRVTVLARPPVSNMYESMIYMNWALMVFAAIFTLVKKNETALYVGSLISAFIMLYANLLPIDPSLEVLVPVLRSNYWLSIHVMTVVSSYGAFGLAMGLGHRHLYLATTGKFSKKAETESADLIHKVIQLGALLIGTGTVLGGVWANESWGRFWGWDPKETWALITFLGYLIIIHLRYARKISDFGLALGAVLGFLLVLMTWYGVNFVLGRGLHSYGAGSGGMQWVIYYLIFEALFLGWIFSKRVRPSAS